MKLVFTRSRFTCFKGLSDRIDRGKLHRWQPRVFYDPDTGIGPPRQNATQLGLGDWLHGELRRQFWGMAVEVAEHIRMFFKEQQVAIGRLTLGFGLRSGSQVLSISFRSGDAPGERHRELEVESGKWKVGKAL